MTTPVTVWDLGQSKQPAPGDISQIGATRDALGLIADDAGSILKQLRGLDTSSLISCWEGATPVAFAEKFAGLRTLLGHMETMHRGARDILQDYVTTVGKLQQEVREALARAQTHWDRKATSQSEVNTGQSRVSTLSQRITRLRQQQTAVVDPAIHQQYQVQIDSSSSEKRRAEETVRTSSNSLSRAKSGLTNETTALHDIRRRFDEADSAAADRFRHVIPGALEDYNILERAWNGLKELAAGLRDLVAVAVEAVAKDSRQAFRHSVVDPGRGDYCSRSDRNHSRRRVLRRCGTRLSCRLRIYRDDTP